MRTSEQPTWETKSKRVPAGSTALRTEMPLKNLAVTPTKGVPAGSAPLPTETGCVIVMNCGGGGGGVVSVAAFVCRLSYAGATAGGLWGWRQTQTQTVVGSDHRFSTRSDFVKLGLSTIGLLDSKCDPYRYGGDAADN
jgi:hypothetical protein